MGLWWVWQGTGQRADTVKTPTLRELGASLASPYLYTQCSGREKLTLIQHTRGISLTVSKCGISSHKAGWWNRNPDTSFLTGDRIDDSRRKCILLKRRMNYDSFHIKQTYLWQRALRAPSTSTDTITNWPANHLALASKVQIRYLRSLKEDSTVCRFPLYYYRNHVLALNEKAVFWSLLQHEKDLSWFNRGSKMEAISRLRLYTLTEIAL